jgi:hypothetical protein
MVVKTPPAKNHGISVSCQYYVDRDFHGQQLTVAKLTHESTIQQTEEDHDANEWQQAYASIEW